MTQPLHDRIPVGSVWADNYPGLTGRTLKVKTVWSETSTVDVYVYTLPVKIQMEVDARPPHQRRLRNLQLTRTVTGIPSEFFGERFELVTRSTEIPDDLIARLFEQPGSAIALPAWRNTCLPASTLEDDELPQRVRYAFTAMSPAVGTVVARAALAELGIRNPSAADALWREMRDAGYRMLPYREPDVCRRAGCGMAALARVGSLRPGHDAVYCSTACREVAEAIR
ncbi:hypothetical protein [Nonomuraea salmonea]|uniref:Uncharacterized protein n=1 Tax=Nonomuraea salmonea TaxID=46181 RepID=A0ABV5P314_9ACTN